MKTETILIIIGAIFLLIGFAGKLKLKDGEVLIKSFLARVLIFIFGITFLVLGIVPSFYKQNKTIPPRTCNVCITFPIEKGIVSGSTIVKGKYQSDSADLWIFIWPEKGGNNGWPQSDDALNGKPAFKSNGKWSVSCGFGGPTQNYDIVLYSSTKAASKIIGDTISLWAKRKDYPGLNINNLPTGLIELDRITVQNPQP